MESAASGWLPVAVLEDAVGGDVVVAVAVLVAVHAAVDLAVALVPVGVGAVAVVAVAVAVLVGHDVSPCSCKSVGDGGSCDFRHRKPWAGREAPAGDGQG